MSVLDLARADIRALVAYSSARTEFGGTGVALNANESPWPAEATVGADLNRYPQPQPRELLERLAALYKVCADQVLVGRGSDEAIDLLVRAFCRAQQDSVLICPPTFGMYAVAARIQGARVIEVPMTAQFEFDAPAVLAKVDTSTRLVFLCTPNNPSGRATDISVVESMLIALQGRAVLVVDEAYAEFSDIPSASRMLARYDNLAVLRTLSKAHALAGARVGVLLANACVVELLRRIIAPYPLPTPSADAALACLTPSAMAQTDQRVQRLRSERERLRVALQGMRQVVEVLPSDANFLCVRWRDAAVTYQRLLRDGFVLRDVSRYAGLANCLRISVGTVEQNEALLLALRAQEGTVQ